MSEFLKTFFGYLVWFAWFLGSAVLVIFGLVNSIGTNAHPWWLVMSVLGVILLTAGLALADTGTSNKSK